MKELMTIQTLLNAPKNQFNRFGGYRYRSCEDILGAVKPLLKDTETTLTISDEIIMIGDRVYVKATATITNGKGEQVSASAFAREPQGKKGMDDSQITGSASSYARKYALNGLLAIDDTRDADTMDNRSAGQPAAQPSGSMEQSVQLAITQIQNATTLGDLKAIYEIYTTLQKEPAFLNALSARKKEIA